MEIKILLHHENMRLAGLSLNQEMLPVFLGLMLAAAAAWLFISNRLYGVLRQNYPRKYEMLGRPKLFMKKSFTTNIRVVKFVFNPDFNGVDDTAVMGLCWGLRALFCIYMICLAGTLLLIFNRMG